MSLATLRTLLIPETQLELPSLVELAQSRQKNVTVFDVETTTFLGNSHFGIIEVSMLHINPKGKLGWTTAFVNPERPIAPSTSQKTGIYTDNISQCPTWGKSWAQALVHVADKHIVIGFNCIEKALAAVQDQNKRYGMPAAVFKDVIDVKALWNVLQKGKKGSLSDIADYYGVPVDETHRAQADVATTAKILDKMVQTHGNSLLSHPQRAWSPKTGTPSAFTVKDDGATVTIQSNTRIVPSNTSKEQYEHAVVQAKDAAKDALLRATSIREFISIIEERYPVRFTMSANKIHGYSLNVDGIKVKGSQIGENFTWTALIKEQGLLYEPIHDLGFIQTRSDSLFGDKDVSHSENKVTATTGIINLDEALTDGHDSCDI